MKRRRFSPSPRHAAPRRAERGVTLIVVLLILVVVTLVGLGAAQLALLGERSTRYDRDYLVASQAAEAALMDAEFDIRGPNTGTGNRVADFSQEYGDSLFAVGCGTTSRTRGLCIPAPDGSKPVWATVDFLATGATAPSVGFGEFTGRAFPVGSGVMPALAPRYIIEIVDDKPVGGSATSVKKMYRITAIGFGPREDIQVVMQIAFRKEG